MEQREEPSIPQGSRGLKDLSLPPEPRGMTLHDLLILTLGVALSLAVPTNWSMGWPLALGPPPWSILAVSFSQEAGLVLVLVIFFRRWKYGGKIRSTEWLMLGIGAYGLLARLPPLDGMVDSLRTWLNSGASSLDYSAARWVVAGLALAGAVASFLLSFLLGRGGSRFASALRVPVALVGLSLWFWGPCDVVRVELPSLLLPQGGQLGRDLMGNSLLFITWGWLGIEAIRAWKENRSAATWGWTDRLALVNAAIPTLLILIRSMGDSEFAALLAGGLPIAWLGWRVLANFRSQETGRGSEDLSRPGKV